MKIKFRKKALAVILAIALTLSSAIIWSLTASGLDEISVIGSKTQLSVNQSTWIIKKVEADRYKLMNKESGLYLALRGNAADGYRLAQEVDNGPSEVHQIFVFVPVSVGAGGWYCVIVGLPTNQCIYANDAGNGFVFQSASSWWIPPEGAANNNQAQYLISFEGANPAGGEETLLRSAGVGMYIQSGMTRSEIPYPVGVGDIETGAGSEWIFTQEPGTSTGTYNGQNTALFRVQNRLSGLYLTTQGASKAPLQKAETKGNDQLWTVVNWYGRTVLCDQAGNTLRYKDGGLSVDAGVNIPGGDTSCYLNTAYAAVRDGLITPLHFNAVASPVFLIGKVAFDDLELILPKDYPVEFGTGTPAVSDAAERWIFEKQTPLLDAEQLFKIKNKETGLYLGLDYTNGVPTLYQSEAAASIKQLWMPTAFSGFYFLVNKAYDKVIYHKDGLLGVQNSATWYAPPEGFASANSCQFSVDFTGDLGNGQETFLRLANSPEETLRSPLLRGELDTSADLAVELGQGEPVSENAEKWKLAQVATGSPNYFTLENADTGKYLTLRSTTSGYSLLQSDLTGAANQQWELRVFDAGAYGVYYILVHRATQKCLYARDGQLGFQNADIWYTPPGGVFDSSSYCQFTADFGGQPAWDGAVTRLVINGKEKLRSAVSTQTPESVPEYAAEVKSGAPVSAHAAEWVLDGTATTGVFRLRNAETGLYLHLKTPADGPAALVQTKRQESLAQQWKLYRYANEYGVFFMLWNLADNKIIYAENGKLGIQDQSSWWSPPEGFTSSNYCQFSIGHTDTPPPGTIVSFTVSGAKLRSTVLKQDVGEYSAAAADTFLDRIADGLYWKTEAGSGGFYLVNKLTGLYLTKLSEYRVGLFVEKRANGTQLWTTKAVSGGMYIQNKGGGTLALSANGAAKLTDETAGNETVFEAGTWSGGSEVLVKNQAGLYLTNGFPGFRVGWLQVGGEAVTTEAEKNLKRPIQNWVLEGTGRADGSKQYYRIKSAPSGLYLSLTDAGEIVEKPADGRFSQMFTFAAVTGGWRIQTADGKKAVSFEENGSVKAMDAATGYDTVMRLAGEPRDGLETTIYSLKNPRYLQTSYWDEGWVDTEYGAAGYRTGTPARQKWAYEQIDATIATFRLKNVASGMYLTLKGSVLFQDEKYQGANEKDQTFRFVQHSYYNGVNYFMLFSARGKQMFIGSGTGERAPVELRDISNWDRNAAVWDSSWNGSNDMLWSLSTGNEKSSYPANGAVFSMKTISQYYLEGEGPDLAERTVSAAKTAGGADGQRWILFSIGANYAIQNARTNQFLTANSNERFIQADFTGAANQQWALKYDATNGVYRLVNAAIGKWFGVPGEAEKELEKFAAFDTNVLAGHTGWRLFSVKNGVRTELTGGLAPENYGTYELMTKAPAYYLQGDETGNPAQTVKIAISSPETAGAHTAIADTKVKLQAAVTPPGLSDKVAWTVRTDASGKDAAVEDYEEFDIDAGQYFGLVHFKNTGTVVIRASLISNPAIYAEWSFVVFPNFTQLINRMGEYERLQDGLYTQESYDKLSAVAQDAAKLIARGDEATQDEVKAALQKLSAAFDALQTNPGGGYRKEIVVNLTEPAVIPSDIFRQAKEEDRVRTYNLLDGSGAVRYSWKFSFPAESNPNYSANLGLSFDSDFKQLISLFSGNEKVLSLNLFSREILPGAAKLTVSVSDSFRDNDLLALYYFNPLIQSGNLAAKNIKVENGRITIDVPRGAEYFLVYTGHAEAVKPETEDKAAETPKTPETPDVPDVPDAVAPALNMAVIEAAITSSSSDTLSIRLSEPGILTVEMMEAVKKAGKKLKIELANTAGEVYLIWNFGAFREITEDVNLALTENPANEAAAKALSGGVLKQFVSLQHKGKLPADVQIILLNQGGFTTGGGLLLYAYDAQAGALRSIESGAAISNDGRYVAFSLTEANEYLIELPAEKAAKPDPGPEKSNWRTIWLIAGISAAVLAAGAAALVLLIKKSGKRNG